MGVVGQPNEIAIKGDKEPSFEDETIMERIIGLREMFPEPLTNLVAKVPSVVKVLFSSVRLITWTLCTTAVITILPLSVEMERAEYEQQQKNRERNMIFGPES